MDQSSKHSTQILTYDGRIGDIYRIFLINLLLTIVTLGIWRFWAMTRMRRYIWSRTSAYGDRFEYDGTGGQIFAGFLVALAVIAGMFVVAAVLGFLLRPISPMLSAIPFFLAYLTVVVLALGAPFSAQRYRLGHTIWRGIRGGMEGSMIKFGVRSLLYSFALVLTFFQLLPWVSLRLFERRINASSFGSVCFVAQGRAGALYGRFLLTSLAIIAFATVAFGGLFAAERPLFIMLRSQTTPAAAQAIAPLLGFYLMGTYLVVTLGAALMSASYQAAFFRHVVGNTRLGDMAFASDVTAWDMLKLQIGNALLLLFTLGLGYPVVLHRTMRFYTTHLLATGMLDLAALKQTKLPASSFGEGMFQALDASSGGF
jgi:uncharacterized membrane protein YjgN (DUF898 family)